MPSLFVIDKRKQSESLLFFANHPNSFVINEYEPFAMAVLTLATSAAVGALTLALSTTYLAFRTRKRLLAQTQALREALESRTQALGALDAATSAFEEAFFSIEDQDLKLVWGEDTLLAAAHALGLKNAKDATCAPRVFELLGQKSNEASKALDRLIIEGKPCRFEIFAENPKDLPSKGISGLSLAIEGRPCGATSWIRLAITGLKPSLASGPFAQVADKIPSPCLVTGQDGRLIWANRAYLEAIEAETLDGAITHRLSLDQGLDSLMSESAEQKIRREGFRWISVGGIRRAFQMVAEPLNESHTVAYLIDVTESEESREVVKRHAKAQDETLNALEDAVVIFGLERQLIFHNQAFEALWGLETAWLAERPSHAEWLDRLRQQRKLPETGDYTAFKAAEMDYYGQTKGHADDMWSLPDGRAIRVVRQPHAFGGLMLAFSDKTSEIRLRAQFNSLIQVQKATLDQIGEAVAVFGSDGRLRLKNLSFDRFWRLNPAEMVSVFDFDLIAHACLPSLPERGFWGELKGRITDTDPVSRAPQGGEARLSDGRLTKWRTQPLPDGATLVVFSDITATRALEEAILARDEALNESVRLKREFVANVSYELRTPLTTIVGYSELLRAKAAIKDKKHQDYLDSIQSAAKELARSIDDVLDMAQIDAGEMVIAKKPLKLADLKEMTLITLEDICKLRNVALAFDGFSPEVDIEADPKRMAQIISHLCDYAARNASSGTQVKVGMHREALDAVLSISYEGRGIPYHVQAHIFDRFVGRERGGPGLALALVKALVELHDGFISLQSEPAEGARFDVRIPQLASSDTMPKKPAKKTRVIEKS